MWTLHTHTHTHTERFACVYKDLYVSVCLTCWLMFSTETLCKVHIAPQTGYAPGGVNPDSSEALWVCSLSHSQTGPSGSLDWNSTRNWKRQNRLTLVWCHYNEYFKWNLLCNVHWTYCTAQVVFLGSQTFTYSVNYFLTDALCLRPVFMSVCKLDYHWLHTHFHLIIPLQALSTRFKFNQWGL